MNRFGIMAVVSSEEIVVTCLLFCWIIFVVAVLTKYLYTFMMRRNFEHHVAIYYNRKVIHMLTGGLVAVFAPSLFKTPLLPFISALILGLLTFIPHKLGKLMYWFQTEENMYEVSFCIMWGVVIALGWLLSGGNFIISVLPVIFMSFGDAITGVVRNILYKKRTKSWYGNLVMAMFTIPTGAILGFAGILAGAAASFIEHFEFNPIDDNVTVPLTSFLILILANYFAPGLLTF